MDNHTYWTKRQEAKYLVGEKLITDYYKGLEKAFLQSQKEINNVVNSFYIRYANENNVTFQEAQKLLTRAELGELQEFIDMAKEYMGEYNLELNNMSIKARVTRYEALQKQIDVTLQKLYAVEYEQKGRVALQSAYTESYYRTWWNIDCYKGFHSEFAQVNPVLIDELINYPFNGANYSDRIWKQKDHMLYKLKESLTTAMIQGKNPNVLASAFAKQFDAKTKDAYGLLHTESSFIIEQATQKMYEEDGLEKYEWSATLDLKTCHDCSPLDGEIFDVGKGIVGKTLPPKHNRCRCTTIPYLGEEYKASTRAARDPVTGKTITVENVSYDEWHKKYVKGNPKAELAVKKQRNISTDKKQYEEYKKILGKEVPKSVEAFQSLKYNEVEKWHNLKKLYRQTNWQVECQENIVIGNNIHKVPITGEPNSVFDNYKDGKLESRRYYGSTGKVRLDIDLTNHGNAKEHPLVPHAHDWNFKDTQYTDVDSNLQGRLKEGRELSRAEWIANGDILKGVKRDG